MSTIDEPRPVEEENEQPELCQQLDNPQKYDEELEGTSPASVFHPLTFPFHAPG